MAELRKIQTRRRTGLTVSRRKVAAAIREVMAERDEATIRLLTPPSERKKARAARK